MCDFLLVAKFIMGVALVSIGVYKQEWFGLIGLWPIFDFINAIWWKKGNRACAYTPPKTKKI